MASSDDEGDIVPKTVSDYEFISGHEEPISFATLPVEWNQGDTLMPNKEKVFLSGKTDNGLRKIFVQVVAWKFNLSFDTPSISVLSQEGNWIRLLKPRKPYEDTIRTILITMHFLHFVKRNPQRPEQDLWDRLIRTFSTFERRPSEDDLAGHLPLINEAVKRDEALANSKVLSSFLNEPVKRKPLNEVVNPSFIVDDENDDHEGGFDETDENGDAESEKDDCFDSVCAFCDNGGTMTLCDGICLRSFHATEKDGEDSQCETLGFTDRDVEAIKDVSFICKNCQHKQHQCFACGILGSSDESSSPEVFCCANGACGFFYHPSCVAKLLHPGNKKKAEEHQQKIAAGEQFACPIHRCHACKELEVRSTWELQFAVCRRCPRAYHRKCLPREIAFEDDDEQGIVQRAWEKLLPKRVLIYCLNHEIDPVIYTPVRDHIRFPGQQREKTISAKPPKEVDKVSFSSKEGSVSRRRVEELHAVRSSKMRKVVNRNDLGRLNEPIATTEERKMSLGNKGTIHGEHEKTEKMKPTERRINISFTLGADAKKSIFKLMKDASLTITAPSTNNQHSKFMDNITLGKVEGSIQSLRAALKNLEGGGTIQDAKMVCGSDLLVQMLRWKDKMRVFLAPFLHGQRYTSFGRHFTKPDKLKEIVDMLHWYVQDGDMLVDFCCGSNDFSCLVKKKLDEMGRRCSFKNYDLHQAKNDFNFELRNWMQVRRDELPDGSQLIMGLNPPFGVNASLANKFINKALEFNPKLLILIVPRETERLDKKACQYDLIWEDDQMFSGKSFYLPGSVDVNDNQIEDWNVNAPVLYLWSRKSFSSKHKAIAEQHGHGHLLGGQNKGKLEESRKKTHVPNSLQESCDLDKPLAENKGKLEESQKKTHVPSSLQENRDFDKPLGERAKNNASAKENHSKESPNEFNGKREGKKRSNSSASLEDEPSSKRAMPCQLSPNVADCESLEKTHSPKRLENQLQLQVHSGFDHMDYSPFQPSTYAPAAGYNTNETVDDVVRRYNSSGEPSMTGQSGAYARSPPPNYGFDRLMAVGANGYDNRSHFMGELNEEFHSWNQRSVYPPPPPPPPAAYPGSYPGFRASPMYSEINNTSAMQRYAPRLDDLNHGRMSNMGVPRPPPPPPLHDVDGIYHRRDSRPTSSLLGFAPGPYRPYSPHNSSGWLNE